MTFFSFLSLLSCLLILGSAIFILAKNPGGQVNRLFFALTVCLSACAFGEYNLRQSPTYEQASFWLKFMGAWVPLSLGVFLHFLLYITGQTAAWHAKRRMYGLVYLPAFAFGLLEYRYRFLYGLPVARYWGWTYEKTENWYIWAVFMTWFFCVITTSLFVCIKAYRTNTDPIRRKEIAGFGWSVLWLFSAGLILDLVPKLLGRSFPEVLYFAIGGLVVYLAVALWRQEIQLFSPALAAEEILSIIPDCLLLVATDGSIAAVNRAACRLLRYEEKELVGKQISAIFSEKSRDSLPFKRTRMISLEKEGAFSDIEAVFVDKSGGDINVSLSETLVRQKDGRLAGVILLARDLTERKRMEAELQKTQKLESLGNLAGGIAHDFNNILTAVIGNVFLAKKRVAGDAEAQELLRSVEKAAQVARGLSRQLLTFARGGEPIKSVFSVSKLVHETAGFALKGSNIQVEFHDGENLHAVNADREQIAQVLTNVIINARQAMPEGGVIRISTRNADVARLNIPVLYRGACLHIAVSDKGHGIKKEDLHRVFDPFYTTKAGGTGLGLAISFSIVKKHGGYIDIESTVGTGTTVNVYLPALDEVVPGGDTRQMAVLRGNARILVMDDDSLVRTVTSRMLSSFGYTVETAPDASSAAAAFGKAIRERAPFDLVILDLTIPGGPGGKEAIGELRKLDPRIKAIACSGYSNDIVLAQYSRFGFDGAMTKPFDIEGLNAMIHNLTRNKAPGTGSSGPVGQPGVVF